MSNVMRDVLSKADWFSLPRTSQILKLTKQTTKTDAVAVAVRLYWPVPL